MGRREKLTPEVEEKFLQAIRLGCPIKDAAGCAGIGEATYHHWRMMAETGINPTTKKRVNKATRERYSAFLKRVKEVEGEATRAWLAVIEKAAKEGKWTAAAWKLERRRAMFIPRSEQRVEGVINADVKVEVSSARDRILDKLAGLAADDE
jgi:transposase